MANKIFIFSKFLAQNAQAITDAKNNNGGRPIDFRIAKLSKLADVNHLWNCSRDLSQQACEWMVGSFFVVRRDNDRYHIIARKAERGWVSAWDSLGSFPVVGYFREQCVVLSQMLDDPTGFAFCLKCGDLISENSARDHKCPTTTERCRTCGKGISNSDAKKSRAAFGSIVCPDCAKARVAVRLSYHTRPMRLPIDNKHRDSVPTLGLEVELEPRSFDFSPDTIAGKLYDAITADVYKPVLYFNADGSLRANGIEAITKPMTAAQIERLDFKSFFATAVDEGLTASDNTGIHCHCDRAFFGQSGRDSMRAACMLMHYLNKYDKAFDAVFGRKMDDEDHSGYNKKMKKSDDLFDVNSKISGSRYYAVNVQNSATIELRVFASTTDADRFFAIVDIAQALFRFAKKAKFATIDRAKFGEWCRYLRHKKTLDAVCAVLKDSDAKQCRSAFAKTHGGIKALGEV